MEQYQREEEVCSARPRVSTKFNALRSSHSRNQFADVKYRLRYYEWLTKGKDKFPHFTKHKEPNKIMLLAGLYDVAHIEGSDEPLVSFTIVTTAACKAFEWLHERQPVILSTEEKLNAWLDTSSQTWDGKNMKSLLEPFSDEANPLEWSVLLLLHRLMGKRLTGLFQ